jgi:hypothetical protein
MTKLAEIQAVSLDLPVAESPEMIAAIDEADRSLAAEGGVPVEDVRQNLRRWING